MLLGNVNSVRFHRGLRKIGRIRCCKTIADVGSDKKARKPQNHLGVSQIGGAPSSLLHGSMRVRVTE